MMTARKDLQALPRKTAPSKWQTGMSSLNRWIFLTWAITMTALLIGVSIVDYKARQDVTAEALSKSPMK
jgi:hypothetical protein